MDDCLLRIFLKKQLTFIKVKLCLFFHFYYLVKNFCNLSGLEQWYFSLI